MITLAVVLSFGVNMPTKLPGDNADSKSCEEQVKKVNAYYQTHGMQDKVYFKFSIQTFMPAEAGEKVTAQLWKNGDRMQYDNPFLTVFRDKTTQVIVLKDRRLVIVRDNKPNDLSKEELGKIDLSPMIQLDSLTKYQAQIECSATKEGANIVINLPEKINEIKNPYKRIELRYDSKSGALKKGMYDFNEDVFKRTVYEYLVMSNRFDANILSGSALGKVMNGNVLKGTYNNYTLKDLRIN